MSGGGTQTHGKSSPGGHPTDGSGQGRAGRLDGAEGRNILKAVVVDGLAGAAEVGRQCEFVDVPAAVRDRRWRTTAVPQ
ncbi:protein of unknown function [Paraburkholderia dioscoreae]|uniref:Uncharacterized protein n=1 Tax=Paraburkholderia dioscoreae TaxID=2604047 RepID=A0A5Q4Z1Z3_9BURK|nr:protein of unknown function [Paraburkholderia dioscoreae]